MTSDLSDFVVALTRGDHSAAAALYSGPFLDGFHLADASEFERWVERERSRYAGELADAIEALAAGAASRNDHVVAAAWWRRLAVHDPVSSRVALRWMEALAAAGDTAGALRVGQAHETLLREELESTPDPAVTAFADRLRATIAVPSVAVRSARTSSAEAPSPDGPMPAVASGTEDHIPGSATDRPPPALASAVDGGEPRIDVVRRRTVLALAACVVAALGIAVLASRPAAPLTASDRTPPPRAPLRYVVAPFENVMGDTSLAQFGRVSADWITKGLAETGLVEVVDMRTVLDAIDAPAAGADRRHPPSVRQLSQATGAQQVVTGTYIRYGDTLTVDARVVDAATGQVLQTLDAVAGPAGTPMVPLDRLRQRLLGAFGQRYGTGGPANAWHRARRPPTYAAYEAFMETLRLDQRGAPPSEVARSAARAVALDSDYTDAWILLAASTVGPRSDSIRRRLDARHDALSPFERAQLDLSQTARRGDLEGYLDAARELDRMAPGSNYTLSLGLALLELQRPAEALDVMRRIDPDRGLYRRSIAYWYDLAVAHHMTSDGARSLAAAREGLRRFPDSAELMMLEAEAYGMLGRAADVERVANALMQAHAGWGLSRLDYLADVAREARAHGLPELGRRLHERALATWTSVPPESLATRPVRFGRASALYALGRWSEARPLLAGLIAERPTAIQFQLPAAFGERPVALRAMYGEVLAHLGDRAGARMVAQGIADMPGPDGRGVRALARARIAAALGERDAAVALLRDAESRHPRSRAGGGYAIHADAAFDVLRDYPPARELLTPNR